MVSDRILDWLLAGDISLRYQTRRDLLGVDQPSLQTRIAAEGWGARLLRARRADGHWGRGFYQPKWTSTHYSLLDLRHLEIAPNLPEVRQSVALVARDHKGEDGGINPSVTIKESDVCINGMFLTYGCYFNVDAESLRSIVDFLIAQHMPDGGFNCHFNRQGAVHSSLHSTLSILEGILEYGRRGYRYRRAELEQIAGAAREFILQHELFRSDRTGAVIDPKMLRLSYPSRWRYDILRALVYFQAAGAAYDPRMRPALDVLLKKRRPDGTWPVQARHPGQSHFEMEKTGGPSRWNTLRALRVFKHFDIFEAL